MSAATYNTISMAVGLAVLAALVVAACSLALMVRGWRTPERRRHARRLQIALGATIALIGTQQAILWLVFLPAMKREQTAQNEMLRAEQVAKSSLCGIGDQAPDFEITDIDGAQFSVSGPQGDVAVLNFFATWCQPCQRELPHVEQLWTEHRGDRRFRLLVIGREETNETVRDFRAQKNFTFPIAADPDRAFYARFATELIPRTIVISPAGTIVYSAAGFDERELAKLRSVIEQQLSLAD